MRTHVRARCPHTWWLAVSARTGLTRARPGSKLRVTLPAPRAGISPARWCLSVGGTHVDDITWETGSFGDSSLTV